MKRICTFFLLMIALISCVSCSSKHLNSEKTTDNNLPEGVEHFDGERRDVSLHINSYTEYLAFLAKHDLPDNFLYYDQIKEFGEFKELIVSHYYDYTSEEEQFECFRYELADKNEIPVHFQVYLNDAYEKHLENLRRQDASYMEKIDNAIFVSAEPIGSDLRKCKTVDTPDDDSSIVLYKKQVGNMTYIYAIDGTLNNIVWNDNGIRIILGGTKALSVDYPMNQKQTAMSKLLDISTAEKVCQEFSKKLTAKD